MSLSETATTTMLDSLQSNRPRDRRSSDKRVSLQLNQDDGVYKNSALKKITVAGEKQKVRGNWEEVKDKVNRLVRLLVTPLGNLFPHLPFPSHVDEGFFC